MKLKTREHCLYWIGLPPYVCSKATTTRIENAGGAMVHS